MYKRISELPMPAEEIGKELFDSISSQDYEFGEMYPEEKRFLFGLIRHFKPENILEIGVSSGGGSGLILAAINDMDGTTLTSIDYAENAYSFPDKPVGFVALRKHSDNPGWNLITGKDPSQVIEDTGRKYDFVVLDTAHYHPVETLNFLSVLPFLEDGAIVVLHDISLFLSTVESGDDNCLATRYLFSTVAAEKIMPKKYPKIYMGDLVNIGAFQVTDDTRKYIEGVFSSLVLPWSMIPEKRVLKRVGSIIKAYYPERLYSMFEDAIHVIACKQQLQQIVSNLSHVLKQYHGKYILFGARNAAKYLKLIRDLGYDMPLEIWDNKVDAAQFSIYSFDIKRPHFDIPNDIAIMFTVRTEHTYQTVVEGWPQEFKKRIYFFKELS